MKYNTVPLAEAITGIAEMAEAETDKKARNVLFSARDYLEMFQTETEHIAMSWESILECKKQKNKGMK